MAKYYGKIGFVTVVETAPGVHTEQLTEVDYTGDILRQNRRYDDNQRVNDGMTLSARVSILADAFALDNVAAIRYVTWVGSNWEVTSFEIEHPRIILSLGGVYNG